MKKGLNALAKLGFYFDDYEQATDQKKQKLEEAS
jgi:hypothetical protein